MDSSQSKRRDHFLSALKKLKTNGYVYTVFRNSENQIIEMPLRGFFSKEEGIAYVNGAFPPDVPKPKLELITIVLSQLQHGLIQGLERIKEGRLQNPKIGSGAIVRKKRNRRSQM